MIIADTSALIALYSESGVQHDAVAGWLARHNEVMVISPYVVAELDYLIATRSRAPAGMIATRSRAPAGMIATRSRAPAGMIATRSRAPALPRA